VGSHIPGGGAASTCSSTGTLQEPCHASDYPASAPGGLSKRGRRSSVLRAAALPGHKLFSSSVQTSRSLLLAKMSKAKRKAYMAYTQQMAEYFAEVGGHACPFQLVSFSPMLHPEPRLTAACSKPGHTLPEGLAGIQLAHLKLAALSTACAQHTVTCHPGPQERGAAGPACS
jgi:hypothetical protein